MPNLDKIRLFVFDLDGTLIDAFKDIWVGVNYAMAQCNLPQLDYERVRNAVGNGARNLIRTCLGPKHLDRFDDVYPIYREYYTAHPIDSATLYPGVIETLEALREREFKLAILTNKPDEVTQNICDTMKLSSRVDGIWGERPGSPRKPDPESLQMILRHFQATPEMVVMVGDGPADFEVAKSIGANIVAVAYGLTPLDQLQQLYSTRIIHRFDELLDII